MQPLHFFFYGTLIAGYDNPAARVVHARLRAVGPGTVSGALWAIRDSAGWYPALVTAPDRRAFGMLYAAMDGFGADELACLDAWEDCRPDQPEQSRYLREDMQVTDATGASHRAQAYRFNRPLPADALAIPDGDFQAWLTATGYPAYGS
jgi:gamma-glutamylcyclotransferase (GGCT)/AIG2-like uncharacterized protein YtfP